MMPPRICLLEQAETRSSTSVVPQLIDRLRQRGCDVEVCVPETQPGPESTLIPNADLYLWKSHGRLCDSVAAYLHADGRPLLNDYLATTQVRDKFVTTRRLLDAGLPTPEAFCADTIEQLASVVDRYPVVVKPNSGRRGQLVALVNSKLELLRFTGLTGPVFAQSYVEGNGVDLKMYVIGDQVFGVTRPSPLAPDAGNGRGAFDPSREIRDISLRCGELFGLDLYGVDLLETPDGPLVIEVNCFPGYKGVPDADIIVARYILEQLRSAR